MTKAEISRMVADIIQERDKFRLDYLNMKDAVRANGRGVARLSKKYKNQRERLRKADELVADCLAWLIAGIAGDGAVQVKKLAWEVLTERCREYLGLDRKRPEGSKNAADENQAASLS